MNYISAYRDTNLEIEILELRLMDLETQAKLALKVCETGKQGGDPPVYVPLDVALRHYDQACARLRECAVELDRKKLIQAKMEQNLERFRGIEYQVAYKRDIEGKPLYVIADELGYSLSWIQKVSSGIKKTPR